MSVDSRQHPRGGNRREAGFTLLELIIVIAIFAVLAAMAYGGLSSVLNSRARIEAQMTNTSQYQKVYLRLRQDFQNASARSIRDNDGQVQPAFLYDSYTHRVDFTRAGWTNPLYLPRTGFERVSYAVDEDGRLVRTSWRVLDRSRQTEAVKVILLDGVDQLSWSFLDAQLQPQENWPPSNLTQATSSPTPPGPPAAVEMRFRTRDWGNLRFLFKTSGDPGGAGAAQWSTQWTNPNGTNPSGNNPPPPNGGKN